MRTYQTTAGRVSTNSCTLSSHDRRVPALFASTVEGRESFKSRDALDRLDALKGGFPMFHPLGPNDTNQTKRHKTTKTACCFLSINMNGWLGRDILRCETFSVWNRPVYFFLHVGFQLDLLLPTDGVG